MSRLSLKRKKQKTTDDGPKVCYHIITFKILPYKNNIPLNTIYQIPTFQEKMYQKSNFDQQKNINTRNRKVFLICEIIF